jgi:chaperone BCS1
MFKRLIGRFAISSGNQTQSEIEEKARSFAQQLPVDVFTPAQVQNFLQSCRGNPDKAVSEISDWASRNLPRPTLTAPQPNGVPRQGDTAGNSGDADAGMNLMASNGDTVLVPDHPSDSSVEGDISA